MKESKLIWRWRLVVLRILVALLMKMRYPEWGVDFDSEFGENMQDLDMDARALIISLTARSN